MNDCFLAPFVGDSDLSTKAKSLELGAFDLNSDLISRTYSLDALLEAAYNVRCPEPYEHENRQDLICIFNIMAKELYGNGYPVVVEFGSFVMNMFSSDSDLDLSINFNNHAAAWSKKQRVNALRRFAKKFRKLESRGLVKDVLLVAAARVPVLKVTDQGTNIECDFSVENRDGIAKSHIVFIIATIDERLRKLSIMLKAWAKAHSINSSKDGTLNSLSLILLAAFHLQCTEPPILPPFSAFLKDGFDPPTVQKNVTPYVNYGEKNKESLVQLFVTLLIRLKSVETLWSEGLCASVYEGSWIYKRFKNKLGIYVEDFSDRSQNVARALHSKKVGAVYKSIDKSLSQIQNFVDGKIQWQQLEKLLFGPRPPRLFKNSITLQNASCHPILHHPIPKETQLAQKAVVNPPPSTDGVKTHDQSAHLKPVLHYTKESQLVPIKEGDSSSSKGHQRRPMLGDDSSPIKKMRLTEKKTKRNKMNRKETLASSESDKQQQPRKRLIPETGGTSQGHRIMSHEAEAFERSASYATHNPSIYMHRAGEQAFAPPFGHEAASSSQSFVVFPPPLPYPPYRSAPVFPAAFRNAPYHQSPQFFAGYPPIRDPAYDPYFSQASHNVYRVPQAHYPGRMEHYRTPEVPYPGRLERIWSDYSHEVRSEVPYPGRAQAWSNRPSEGRRGDHRPPFYR
ncbi:hypothetical protein V2J09_010798 [Rumex salicifolius]